MSRHGPAAADQRSEFERRLEEVSFLAGSTCRVRLLSVLARRGRLTRDELRDVADASRTTVQRNLDALEERGWIASSAREYRATPCGALVVEELCGLLETVGVAVQLQTGLQWLPRGALDFDLRHLADARVTVATASDPYAPVNRYAQTLEAATRFRGVVSSVGFDALRTVDGTADRDWTVVLDADALETLQTTAAYAAAFASSVQAESVDLYVYGGGVPFSLGLVDGRVEIGVEDDEGMPRALIETESERVREWAAETVADYRQQAERYDPAG
ncbi:MAG: helix-turn-helix transcriptional regulator [Haloarculaceae archaeon]